eukprot:SAG31_NODE_3582_length_4100_cov_3.424394_2_plen_410_part_00
MISSSAGLRAPAGRIRGAAPPAARISASCVMHRSRRRIPARGICTGPAIATPCTSAHPRMCHAAALWLCVLQRHSTPAALLGGGTAGEGSRNISEYLEISRNISEHLRISQNISGACASSSDCYGLGDCVGGRCRCDPWASIAPDCSAFAVDPVEYDPAPGYRNASQQSWGGAFIPDPHGGPGHGFLGAKSPMHRWEPGATDFRGPTLVHVRSKSRAGPLDGPFDFAGAVLNHSFQSQVRRLPSSHGGGFVLFSNSGMGAKDWVASNGLFAAYLGDLDRFGQVNGTVGQHLTVRQVFKPPIVDPIHPWICKTNDWGAEILPDGSVLALFRNGGHHCDNQSYPGWPAEQLGLLRASCWNCTDYSELHHTRNNWLWATSTYRIADYMLMLCCAVLCCAVLMPMCRPSGYTE